MDIYVAHIGTDILCIGTEKECRDHKDAQTFRTDCWEIATVEDYGSSCYESGYDSGHDSGYESASYHHFD